MPEWFWKYSGDLHDSGLAPHWVGVILVVSSMVCGLIAGAEREFSRKPAGLRTLALICVGSTVFTMASIYLASGGADRTRIAAQIVTGIGFLGAGAIVRDRGNVTGLTTAAMIWTMAAIGMFIGGGYVMAGFVLTFVVIGTLTVFHRMDSAIIGTCRYDRCVIEYDGADGKTKAQLIELLDDHRIRDSDRTWETGADRRERLVFLYCSRHTHHRAILADASRIVGVNSIRAGDSRNAS